MGVKLDMSRDYYADLEVPRLADATEIKKSFKKLALKYHPDRNPGKEEEAKEKFILIQAAHEILTNPEAKASYDAKRRNATRHGGGASGVTGNPWMNTARDVNNKYGVPPVRRPPMPPRPAQTTTTGASSRYQGWGTGKQAPKSKTDTFRAQSEAWERARASSTQNTTQNPSRPTKNPSDVPPSPTPRTAAQARRAEAAFGATRRTGFQPSSPILGDEPPVRNYNYNNYTSTSTGDWATGTGYTTANAGSTPAPKPRPHSEFIDPLTQQFRDANLDNRQRTPYASHTGEKTNPFEPLNVNRTKSMRDPGRTVPGEQPAPPPRQRSASVGSDSFQRSTTDPYPSHTNPRPQPQSKASARYSPRTAHQQQQPDSAPATSAGFATAAGFGAAAAAGAAAYAAANSSTSSVNSSTHVNAGTSSTQAKSGPKVFAVPDNDPTSPLNQTRFARHSADNINTQFVSEDQGNFEFSAATDSPSRDDPFTRARQRHRGRQSPLRNEFTASQDRFTPVQPQQPPQVPPKVSAFDPKEWEESIRSSHIFEPKPQSRSSVSPTRPMRPIKKPRPVRMTAGNAAVVDDEETTSGEDKPKTASPNVNGNRSPNAMDVDPPQPETPIHPHEPRNIPVEPTKPEWRAGNVGPNVPGGAPLNPMPATGFRMPAVNPNTVGSEDSEFMKPNMFSEFKNCAPFNEKPTGLGSFADLSTNLPFTSAPSAKLPIPQGKPAPLPCPPVPQVPKVPVSLVISTGRIGSAAWNQYAKEFEAYLKAFSEWNGQMVNHFAGRQAFYEQTGFSWVNVAGDAGYTNYTNAMEQDKPIRQKWITACNAHELAFKEFQQLRWGLLRER